MKTGYYELDNIINLNKNNKLGKINLLYLNEYRKCINLAKIKE